MTQFGSRCHASSSSRLALFGVLLALAAPAVAQRASVAEHYGNIDYHGPDGTVRQLTRDGDYGEPVLSPDGRTIAFVHRDTAARSDNEPGTTSLWIGDGPTGAARRLIGPRGSDDPKANFTSFGHPVFSLDGGYVYVEADAWATSSAIHQISVKTGKERFVIDGWVIAVIRTGPMRGFLLVGRHMYHSAPQYGSYNPVYIVRPDGNQSFLVPGSDKDDGAASVGIWLKRKGWRAW